MNKNSGRISMRSPTFQFAIALSIAIGACVHSASAQDAAASQMPQMSGGMAHMEGHMFLTTLRPARSGDQQKADAIVAAAREAMEPYKDYRKALADGYRIFLPNDPLKPTSLLYKKNPDGGYTLVGAMYTDRLTASQDELNERIPLSVARWHQHVNFCKAPPGQLAAYFGPDAKFGLMGSITTREACDAAGGQFIPHVFGWMVHVYPYESNPAKIWSVDDDDRGHDNMDHSAMPGMNMN
jgi:hypothetical protein